MGLFQSRNDSAKIYQEIKSKINESIVHTISILNEDNDFTIRLSQLDLTIKLRPEYSQIYLENNVKPSYTIPFKNQTQTISDILALIATENKRNF